MKAAVVGTVGVPARYGGFETLAEQLARHIPAATLQLTIYCEARSYRVDERAPDFHGHRRIFLPGRANGIGSIAYDWLALIHAAFVARVDTVLLLGYSGAFLLPWLRLIRPSLRIFTNIDGMEWRRAKFGGVARLLLHALERFAVRFSHTIVADNLAIADEVTRRYRIAARVIPYGGDHTCVDGIVPKPEAGYWLCIARVEPENNARMILAAAAAAGIRLTFVGNWSASAYGAALRRDYGAHPGLTLLDPIYDQPVLAGLRARAEGYVHGHSVGGTNPSLVEALFHARRLASFDCPYNRATLGGAGAWFNDEAGLVAILACSRLGKMEIEEIKRLKITYRWQTISEVYRSLLRGEPVATDAGLWHASISR